MFSTRLFIYLLIYVTGNCTQGLKIAGLVLYHLSYAFNPFVFIYLLRWGLTNFAWAGLKLTILLCLPLK
jgi:hypothetical protein